MNNDDADCNLDDDAVSMMDHLEQADDASVSISQYQKIFNQSIKNSL